MLLSDRLTELGLSEQEFLRKLSDSPRVGEIFDTENEDHRRKTVKSWLNGRRRVPRLVLEEVATDDLLDKSDLLQRVLDPDLKTRPTALALTLALQLHRGLGDPDPLDEATLEPPSRDSTTQMREIVRWATYLLNAGSVAGTGGTILINAVGFEAVFDQVSPGGKEAREWSKALWRVIKAGWRVRHVLSWGAPGVSPLGHSAQAELVVNSLYAAAVEGHYEPVIWSTSPPANVIAVEGIGALAIWQGALGERRTPRRFALLRLARSDGLAALMTGGNAPVVSRFPVPTIALTGDPYSRLHFDMTLAAAESDPEAQHCMVKAGLPTTLIQPEIAQVQEDRWRIDEEELREEKDLAAYVDLHRKVRERRREAFDRLTGRSTSRRYRDILTCEGVSRYIEHGDLGGAAWGGRYLEVEERIRQTRQFADLVASRNNPGYELALVEQRDLLVPVDNNWWAAIRGAGRDSRAVFFLTSREGGRTQNRSGWLSDSGSTSIVEAFFALYDLMWEILPSATRDRVNVASRLRSLADRAEGVRT